MFGVVLGLVAALGFGAAAIFARLGLQYMRPTSGTLVSMVVGTVITTLLAFVFHWNEIFTLTGVAFLWFLIAGTVNFPMGWLLNFSSVRWAGVSRASPVVGSSPLFATILAVTIGGETVTFFVLLGTISITGGLVLILSQR